LSKILVLDIETKPGLGFFWRMFKEDMNVDRMVDPGGVLCIGAKWLGTNEKFFFSEWEDGQVGMAEGVSKLLHEAEGVVTYNGDKFDLQKIRGFLLVNGLDDIPPLTSVDLYRTVRSLGFASAKLAFIGPYLEIGKKVAHEGFSLWVKVMAGDEKAQARMQRYCMGDVRLTERLYKKIKPFIRNHPHFGNSKHECGACGSTSATKRGYTRTKFFITERLKCNRCGSWFKGVRRAIK
jgi:hypothetical protein